MRRPRVYVVNDPGLDFSKAEVFGDVVRLFCGAVNPFRPDEIQEGVASGLDEFDVELDYLCPSGSALAVGFAFSHLAVWAGSGELAVRIKLLLFDSKARSYFAREVSL